jgi:hypothetical protein
MSKTVSLGPELPLWRQAGPHRTADRSCHQQAKILQARERGEMARRTKIPGQARAYSLGGLIAEADPLLQDGFYETSQYHAMTSLDSESCFLIGRTGSGKSALLQYIEEEHAGHVIRINPDALALNYIRQGAAYAYLNEGIKLSAFFIALWKHVFLVEAIRHRYSIHSPAAKRNHLQALRDKIAQNRAKVAALEYLDEFGDSFWCETEERVKEVIERFEHRVDEETGASIGVAGNRVNAGGSSSGTRSLETKTEFVTKVQRVVNDTQTAKLNKMITVLHEDILDSPQNYTYIVIDDLDLVWINDRLHKELVLCLFRAVLELKKVRNLKIIVALRTNIFKELDFASIGGQAEKFWSMTMPIRWTESDLRELLDRRVRLASRRFGSYDLQSIEDILPKAHKHKGDALDHLLRRTMMRPRDAMAYIKQCHELTSGKPLISWDHIQDAEALYSHHRLDALNQEWSPSFPGLDRVFAAFRHCPAVMSRNDLFDQLDGEVAVLLADGEFKGRDWLMDMLKRVWDPKGIPSVRGDLDPFKDVVSLLYDTGFLGVRQASPKGIFSYMQPDFLTPAGALESVQGFVVHPAFWRTLSIEQI